MISRLLIILTLLFGCTCVFCQKTSDRKAIKTLIQTDNNSKFRGYLTGITEDSISLYVPKFSIDTTISFNSVDRIGFLKKSSFWNGFIRGFAVSEAPIIFLTLSEDDSFAQIFIFIVGNILIVAPTSLTSGLVSATPDIRLDISEENFQDLHHSKLNRYALDSKKLRITALGLSQLDEMQFPKKSNRPSLQLDYSPKYYLQVFELGFVWTNYGSQTVQKYSGNYDQSYNERPRHVETTLGFAWSPSMKWEIGGQFATNYQKEVVFTKNEPDYYSSIKFNYSYSMQNIYALRRFSPYQNGYGDRWQFSLGSAISHINVRTKSYINVTNEFTEYANVLSKMDNLFGLGLMGTVDCYLTKHVSLCLRLQNSWFTQLKIDSFSQETYNVQWDSFTVKPMITSLSLGLRGQF